ncbi:Fic family protein [Companilactobacillus kimchiensis]|uniref:Fic family protein n=1 Tax=Companilactobacillus kimchiensis TaxID=993692 RepID=A0A0R2LHG4_9LACO|nr:Fic family protein [Companilactobacillus kimchiensis]KRN98746.1 Fic family protein [Companilactobacillus kimchiensis]
MELKPLSVLKYMSNTNDSIDVSKEYENRLNGVATFKTNLYPYLTDKYGEQHDNYPIFFIETRDLSILSADIYKKSRKIEQLSNSLPGIAKSSYANSLLTNEIQFSNEIEGVKTKREEIGTIVDDLQNNNNTNQKRLVSTVQKYLDILNINRPEIKINSFDDLRVIYDRLTAGEIDLDKLPDGEYFRNSPVRIGTSLETVHTPPANEKLIENKLSTLISFMNNEKIPPIEKSLITHFMFENTHPFSDGNGRMGRYLLSQYLGKKIDPFTALSISGSIHENQQKYYKIFKEADKYENYGELTFFIHEMMRLILDSQNEVLNRMNQLLETLNEYKNNLKIILKIEDEHDTEFEILLIFVESKLFNIDSSLGIKDTDLINMLYREDTKKYKKVKVKGIINKYEEKGILQKINGKPLQHEIII